MVGIAAIYAFSFSFLGQVPGADTQVWIIMLENGARIFAQVEERAWSRTAIPVKLDEPWLPESERHIQIRASDIKQKQVENPRGRVHRLDLGYEENGWVKVLSDTGEHWVSGVEWDRAQLARKLAGVGEMSAASVAASSGLTAGSTVDPAAETPGFLGYWGTHLAVLTAGAALIALVVWSLLLR